MLMVAEESQTRATSLRLPSTKLPLNEMDSRQRFNLEMVREATTPSWSSQSISSEPNLGNTNLPFSVHPHDSNNNGAILENLEHVFP